MLDKNDPLFNNVCELLLSQVNDYDDDDDDDGGGGTGN